MFLFPLFFQSNIIKIIKKLIQRDINYNKFFSKNIIIFIIYYNSYKISQFLMKVTF